MPLPAKTGFFSGDCFKFRMLDQILLGLGMPFAGSLPEPCAGQLPPFFRPRPKQMHPTNLILGIDIPSFCRCHQRIHVYTLMHNASLSRG
jgi:hypothetical protein